jgi:hypothetical protein
MTTRSETADNLLAEARDKCDDLASMCNDMEDFYIKIVYQALAHHFEHGIDILEIYSRFPGGLEVSRPIWGPYVELAAKLLDRGEIVGFQVEDKDDSDFW